MDEINKIGRMVDLQTREIEIVRKLLRFSWQGRVHGVITEARKKTPEEVHDEQISDIVVNITDEFRTIDQPFLRAAVALNEATEPVQGFYIRLTEGVHAKTLEILQTSMSESDIPPESIEVREMFREIDAAKPKIIREFKEARFLRAQMPQGVPPREFLH